MTSTLNTSRQRQPVRVLRFCCGASLALAALLSSACKREEQVALQDPDKNDPVAIRVGGRDVRLSELQAELDFLRRKHNPVAADRESFLESSIERMVALSKARELGLDQDIELRRQWENLLIGHLKQHEIDAGAAELTVTDDEVQAHYQQNLKTYSSPARIHLALLFLKVPAHADETAREAVRQRLQEAREKALKLPAGTRGFGAGAMTWSEEATSRFKGGDIGWLEAGATQSRWPAEVVEAGFALKDNGAVSDVITADDGYYLLKKLDSRGAVVRSLEGRLRATLENAILRNKRAALETQVKDSWKAAGNVALDEEVLSQLKFQATPDHPESPKSFPTKP